MCQAFLEDVKFYQLLFKIDQDIAQQVQQAGCHCDGTLHSARYPRKPRGLLLPRTDQDCWRISFCCNRDGCRCRTTPPSVRFLGRKLYLGVGVVLITALHHGLTAARRQRLIEQFQVSPQTLARWRQWWLEIFPASRCWQAEAGCFIPPIDTTQLPDALLARLQAPDLAARVRKLLLLLAPITTTSSHYLPVDLDPQRM